MFYDDDEQLYLTAIPDQAFVEQCVEKVKTCAANIKDWLTHNLMFNDDKTEIMTMGTAVQKQKFKLSELSIGNAEIQLVDKVRKTRSYFGFQPVNVFSHFSDVQDN